MPRKPRIHYPGAFYHVILRGNGGRPIFFSKADRSRFYLLLQEGVARYSHRVHAVCLMGNHAHLVVQVAEIPLSRIMQNLAFRYTRYLNQRKNRTGHLFQGRYKAVLIDADSYIHELIRYIHLNPVRAGMVDAAEDYFWASHRAYLGLASLAWLTTEFALLQFSRQRERAVRLFREFVNAGIRRGVPERVSPGRC